MSLRLRTHARIESKVTRVTRVTSLIGLMGLLVLAGITVGAVVLRWILNQPSLGVSDVSALVISIVIASCFPLVFAERRSITVRVAGKANQCVWSPQFR